MTEGTEEVKKGGGIILPGSPEFSETFRDAVVARGDPNAIPSRIPDQDPNFLADLLAKRAPLVGANRTAIEEAGIVEENKEEHIAVQAPVSAPVNSSLAPHTMSVVEISSFYGRPEAADWMKDILADVNPDLILYGGDLLSGPIPKDMSPEGSLINLLANTNQELIKTEADDAAIETRLSEIFQTAAKKNATCT